MRPIDAPVTQKRVALVGNPNCGKTTLFNLLTGANQRVGNWAGVTVERKSGYLNCETGVIEVVDLPGTYSLTLVGELAEDERITRDFLRDGQYDLIVNVLDVTNLERNLYLTLQLLELGVPLVIALNRCDLVSSEHQRAMVQQLEQVLGCAVVTTTATAGKGIPALLEQFKKQSPVNPFSLQYPAAVETEITSLTAALQRETSLSTQPKTMRHLAVTYLEGEVADIEPVVRMARNRIVDDTHQAPDVLIATHRYQFLTALCEPLQIKRQKRKWSNRFDRVVLNRFLGLPIFFCVMYAMFFFAINIGGIFQDSVDLFSSAILVDGLANLLSYWQMPDAMISIFAHGLGKGINTTATFIPVIGAMFLALTFLEDSGFMARAAFVMDRVMQALNLPGKAFVPMIVGFGCNVPAILGARHLENKRDRILTIMMSPFMSCGARLAIFTVFVSAFFPEGGQNWVFALYVIGIIMAIFTGLLLKRTLLKGPSSPLILEMPAYQVPHFPTLLRHTWHRLSKFIFNAGKLIVLVCTLIGGLNALHWGANKEQSVLEGLSRNMTVLFEPMGIEEDNWPAAVALFSGLLAKEVVVGTLNTLYAQSDDEPLPIEEAPWSLKDAMIDSFKTIPENASQVLDAIVNPIAASAPGETLTHSASRLMQLKFNGQVGAFAYLLFVLLYFPCVSAMAAIAKEINKRWALFSAIWTTGTAYWTAVIFYQAMTFSQHPTVSCQWFASAGIFFIGVFAVLKIAAQRERRRRPLPTPIIIQANQPSLASS